MKRFLIKDTTRRQREELVMDMLTACAGGCESCPGCGARGGGEAFALYRPYIEGEKELADISAALGAKQIKN